MKLNTTQKVLLLVPFIIAALFVPLIIMVPLIVIVFVVEYALDAQAKKQEGAVKEMSNRDFAIMFGIFVVIVAALIMLFGSGILSLGIAISPTPSENAFIKDYKGVEASTIRLDDLVTDLGDFGDQRSQIADNPASGVAMQYSQEEMDAVEELLDKEEVIITKIRGETDSIGNTAANMKSAITTLPDDVQETASSLVNAIEAYNSHIINFTGSYSDGLEALRTNVEVLRANNPEAMVDAGTPMSKAESYGRQAAGQASIIETNAKALCNLIEGCTITYYSAL